MELVTICEWFEQAAASLSANVQRYWPANGNCEIGEANQTMHLAATLLRNRWHCWSEAHWAPNPETGGDHRRLDLLAWHERSKTLLSIEAKRLYSSEKLVSIASDVQRINSFCPIPYKDTPTLSLQPERHYGVITATSWDRKIINWWNWTSGDDPWPAGTERWDRHGATLDGAAKGIWKSLSLGTEGFDGSTDRHHFLYAVWPIR